LAYALPAKAKLCRLRENEKIRRLKGSIKADCCQDEDCAPRYASIEEDTNPKYDILRKFCEATGINLSFLLAEDLPVTEENAASLMRQKINHFSSYEQLRQRVDVYAGF